jgi:mono/diheme cytochrome c family protein
MKLIATALTLVSLAAGAAHADVPGPQLFARHCASCHGDDGEGGGPVAAVMVISVPSLRTLAQRNGGAFPADKVAAYIDGREQRTAHGTRSMPVWGTLLQDPDAPNEQVVRERIAALVAFIETLQYR